MYDLSLLVYKLEPNLCNKCHDISMMAYELKNTATVNV